MKNLLLLLACTSLLAACQTDFSSKNAQTKGLSLRTETNPAWQHENLRLYPIVADYAMVEEHLAQQYLKTLREGMSLNGFRIMEAKHFGRSADWQSSLTIQNKSQDTILLLSGDVVTGGNQDRVIAQDDIIPPGTVKNIAVFCVEPRRSHYYDSLATPAERQVAAFRGYYNVASPQVRQAVQRTGDQQKVWAAVANVTKANNAESSTGAYAALETENDQKVRREACIDALKGVFSAPLREEQSGEDGYVVGVIAVCGNQVLGADVFGHPDLFKRAFPALLHGYAAEAVTAEANGQAADDGAARKAFGEVAALARPGVKSNETAGKLSWHGAWTHLWMK